MNFDGEYRHIGTVHTGPLREAVGKLAEADWLAFAARQQVYAAHRATQSIPLLYDPDMRHAEPTAHPALDRFAAFLEAPMRVVADYYGAAEAGYFARILLVRLRAGEAIGSHRDHGDSLARAHRIHLPIVTHADVLFGIAGNVRHLAAGELWEINNRKVHGVRNQSPIDRIHLIFDYVVPGEVINDPNGLIVA